MTYKTEIVREINGVIIKEPRKVIKFEDGYYETDDKDRIAFIKRHTDFGNGNICIVEEDRIQSVTPTPEEEKIIEKATRRGRPKKV